VVTLPFSFSRQEKPAALEHTFAYLVRSDTTKQASPAPRQPTQDLSFRRPVSCPRVCWAVRGQELGQRLDDHPELVPRRAGSGDARRNRLAGADDIRQLLIEGQQNGEFCEFDRTSWP
jgi:hypothetical protein